MKIILSLSPHSSWLSNYIFSREAANLSIFRSNMSDHADFISTDLYINDAGSHAKRCDQLSLLALLVLDIYIMNEWCHMLI